MTKGKRRKKKKHHKCILGTTSAITKKYNTEQTLLYSSWASFASVHTKIKTNTVELNTTKHSMQSKDIVLSLDGLDTIYNRK